jgi:hypothetical protein
MKLVLFCVWGHHHVRCHIPVDQSVTNLEKSETLKFKMVVLIRKKKGGGMLQVFFFTDLHHLTYPVHTRWHVRP